MRISDGFTRDQNEPALALSIGMFDGVHQGHQALIDRLNTVSAERSLESAILTFWPHPRLVFNPQDELKLLNTIDEKQYLLAKYGLQNLFLKEFDAAFRNLPAEEFVRFVLVEQLRVQHLIIGYDHTFGKGRLGNFDLLKKMGPQFGFEVEQVPAVHLGAQNISSTQIRNCLLKGDIETANKMLGYEYSISGTVVNGKKIGRTIGYPTANIEVDSIKLLPKKGAYIVDVFVKDKRYKGMLSVGTNPTVEGKSVSTEVYILDFNEDIYGQEISVNFRAFLHEEIKFKNLEELIERLDEDRRLTEEFFL